MIVRTLTAALALAFCAAPALAQTAPDSASMVGKKAPLKLALKDAAGKPTTLAQQMGKKGLVLVLTRSAAWCPYCKAQLIGLRDIQSGLSQRGYALAGLSYDAPEVLAKFGAERAIGYTLLSDKGSRMIDALGMRDPQYAAGSFAHGVPRATILVIAPDGTVSARKIASDYKVRPSNADILAMVDGVKR